MSTQDPIAERLKALKSELQEMGAEIARKAGQGQEAFSRAEAKAKEGVQAGAEAAMAAATPIVEEALREAQQAAEDFAKAASDVASDAQARARATASAHPLTVIAVSFLAGLVLGSLRRR